MRTLNLRRYLLAGLLIALPLWLTWVVFRFVFHALSAVSEPVLRPLFTFLEERTGARLGWLLVLVGALLTLVVLYLLGWVGTRVVGVRLHRALDRLVARVPLIETVYGAAKRLLGLLHPSSDQPRRVVLIGSARTGGKSLGIVTRNLTDTHTGQEYAVVYLPDAPNPASGSLQLVPVGEVESVDLSLEEALSLIVSGGAVAPGRFDAAPTTTTTAATTTSPR